MSYLYIGVGPNLGSCFKTYENLRHDIMRVFVKKPIVYTGKYKSIRKLYPVPLLHISQSPNHISLFFRPGKLRGLMFEIHHADIPLIGPSSLFLSWLTCAMVHIIP